MKYDLMYAHLGNGLLVSNRAREVSGDYDRIAHIGPDRRVTYYKKRLPKEIREEIEKVAKTDNSSASTTQPYMKVFTHPPAKEVTMTVSGHDLERLQRWIDRDADTADKIAVEDLLYEIAEKAGLRTEPKQ